MNGPRSGAVHGQRGSSFDGVVFCPYLLCTPTRRVITGFALVLVAVIGGVYFAFFPSPTPFDHLVERILPYEWYNRVLIWIVARGLPSSLVLVAAVSCVVALSWDRRRAITCLVAAPVAIAITHYLMKPLVGRTIHVGTVVGLGYPSGHMSATAAVVAAAVLAMPPRYRKLAVVVGIGIDLSVAICLILIRWHYATDVLGGAALAIGATLLIDTSIHLLPAPSLARTRARADR